MTELVQSEPCWILRTGNSDLEERHFGTSAAAAQWAARYPDVSAGAEVVQLEVCCFMARCTSCGEAEADAEHARIHPSAPENAVLGPVDDVKIRARQRLWCDWCLNTSTEERTGGTHRIEMRRELQVHAKTLRL
ncbi:hypothetical protein ACIA49_38495 [Kribbella sp. NPDC051587]|uniref:hypothetical protein n=1 Tax=Kribbella sp. NPDC051587 TaxID=3364119 RepID=UPI0037946389